jgi:hypothetical protein
MFLSELVKTGADASNMLKLIWLLRIGSGIVGAALGL